MVLVETWIEVIDSLKEILRAQLISDTGFNNLSKVCMFTILQW